jgi:hypothetical protein
MNVELSERNKDTASKREGKESKNPDTTGNMRDVRQKIFRNTWGRECKRKKNDGEI